MSKTFVSENKDCRKIEVRECDRSLPNEFVVQFIDRNRVLQSFNYNKLVAPALALSILEAAGGRAYVGSGDEVGLAVESLDKHIAWLERHADAAREREQLEAEAFDLYRTYMTAHEPMNAIGSWDMLSELTQGKWLLVARKARELGKEAAE